MPLNDRLYGRCHNLDNMFKDPTPNTQTMQLSLKRYEFKKLLVES